MDNNQIQTIKDLLNQLIDEHLKLLNQPGPIEVKPYTDQELIDINELLDSILKDPSLCRQYEPRIN